MNGAVELPLDLSELRFTNAEGALVQRTVLPNGIRILSEKMPGTRSATVGFWVAVGSRDELPTTFGSTHFLEHLLFKGTPTRSALDIAISFDAVGGEHNAVTSKEYTCYYAKIQDRDLPMAVEVIADMLTSSLIDPVEFDNERGVILEELAMADDDPADVANERLFEAVFGQHPLGRPIGGSEQTISAVGRDAVWDHYRANYRAEDLVITAAGALDHAELVSMVTTALTAAGWDLGATGTPVPRRSTAVAVIERAEQTVLVDRPQEQANLLIGVPGLVLADERRSTLSALNAILGGGMSSRLFQEVREKRGLAYSVHSFASSFSDAGIFGMYAGCSPAKSAQVLELMMSEFRGLARDGVSDEELRRAKGQLSGGSALALEDSDMRMSRLGRSEISLGEYVDLDESLRRLARVTAEDVRVLAAELADRPHSVAAVGPISADALVV
jgi:predicted Zn-dependent peptidase